MISIRIVSSSGSQIPEPLLIFTSKCALKAQISQGLGPSFQIELSKTGCNKRRDDSARGGSLGGGRAFRAFCEVAWGEVGEIWPSTLCPLEVQVSQGLGPLLQIELEKLAVNIKYNKLRITNQSRTHNFNDFSSSTKS